MKSSLIAHLKYLRTYQVILTIVWTESIVLSISHHWLNFWGLPWEKQLLLTFVLAPVLAIPVFLIINRTWAACAHIKKSRWLIILIPSVLAAVLITWRIFSLPEVWHQLEIDPLNISFPRQVQILEIKNSSGDIIEFSSIPDLKDWGVEQGIFVNRSATPEQIRYSFWGPIDRPVRLIFLVPPHPTQVQITVDGQAQKTVLHGTPGEQNAVQINTKYKWGIDGAIIVVFIIVTDMFVFISLCLIAWLIQEVGQTGLPAQNHPSDTFLLRHRGLIFLLFLAAVLHLINALSVPLILLTDSLSYLNGAFQWVASGSLEGITTYRGPGTTLLFAPILVFFGKNPWGIKILLHLFALATVPLAYRLGWQLTFQPLFAFMSALLAVLTPDMLLYSNIVMTEVPNVFFGMLFCTLMLTALEKISLRWMIAAMLTGAFCILLRAENILMSLTGIGFLTLKIIYTWQRQPGNSERGRNLIFRLQRLGLAVLLGILPLIAWSMYNQVKNGFFGISNYAGAVFYDSWIYFGEASNVHIMDENSPAVKVIAEALPPGIKAVSPSAGKKPYVLTSSRIYRFLLERGYTGSEAYQILGAAAKDSMLKDVPLTIEVLFIKLREGFTPYAGDTRTYSLPDDEVSSKADQYPYFERENFSIPAIVRLQRTIYQFFPIFYENIYPFWIFFCLGALLVGIYRKPFLSWGFIAAVAIIRSLLSTVLSAGDWRYVISGLILLNIFGLAWLESLIRFAASTWQAMKNSTWR